MNAVRLQTVWFVLIVVQILIILMVGFAPGDYLPPQHEPQFKPQCLRFKDGRTDWVVSISDDGELIHYGAECLPGIGILDHWEFDFDAQ